MDSKLIAQKARDPRLDFFLGMANWFICLDHVPNNAVSWITLRNFGFSGAADVFIFISGYTAALTYAGIMQERGVIVGATRVLRRAWQLYAAFIVLFAVYVVIIGDVATRYAAPELIYQFNVSSLLDEPVRTVTHGLLLQSKALNLDVLQLYVLLMACFPVVLCGMLRRPTLTVAASFALYLAARQFEWSLPSFPDGSWYFNPFCWQLLFVLGAFCALRADSLPPQPMFKFGISTCFGIAYLAFALAMTMAARFPELGHLLPLSLHDAFIPNDRANLAPYRVLHFVVLALFVTRWVPKDWPPLNWRIAKPLIICGQQSLATFCAGVFLSLAGRLVLITGSGSLAEQILVSALSIATMTLVAAYVSWSKRQDHPLAGRLSRTPSLRAG